jgi:hypothetical protein
MSYDRERYTQSKVSYAPAENGKCLLRFSTSGSISDKHLSGDPYYKVDTVPGSSNWYSSKYEYMRKIYDMTSNPHGYNPVLHWHMQNAMCRHFRVHGFQDDYRPTAYVNAKTWMHRIPPSNQFSYYATAQWADLINDLSDKLNGSLTKGIQIMASVAEAHKTIAMIKNPFALLKTDWRKYAREGSMADLAKGGANVWLERKYGWQSAKYDVRNIARTLSDVRSVDPDSLFEEGYDRVSSSQKTTIGSGTWTYPYGDSSQWSNDFRPSPGWHNASYETSCCYRTFGEQRNTVGCHQMQDLGRRWNRTQSLLRGFGLDTRGMFETIWELTPFSFVIDWLVDPLGLWRVPSSLMRLKAVDIRDLGFSQLLDFNWEFKWISPYSLREMTNPNWYHANYDVQAWEVYPGVGYYRKYERTVGEPPSGDLVTSLFGKGLSLVNGVSGTALIAQRLM